MKDPKTRKFTRIAAEMIGGLTALDNGKCPTCKEPITKFTDRMSKIEYRISGMCQACQDSVFGK